jgi:hypothetical protein
MYTLIGLGLMVAFAYSLIGTFFPGLFPATMRDAHNVVGVYFEVAAHARSRYRRLHHTVTHFPLFRELSTAPEMKRNPRNPSWTVG